METTTTATTAVSYDPEVLVPLLPRAAIPDSIATTSAPRDAGIPTWVWLAVAAAVVFFLMKNKGR